MAKFLEAVKNTLANSLNFSGRASRRDFWLWLILATLIVAICNYIDGTIIAPARGFLPNEDGAGQPLTTVAFLLIALPTFSVMLRRLHDRDWSGWWTLLVIIPLVVVYFFDTIIQWVIGSGMLSFEENYNLLELLFTYSTAPLFLAVITLVMCAMKGTKGPNRFGED